ncbi:Ltp family lipoprotein [Halobacillus sp. GSS1]|uniref:Ltp family lipoprotein n=1 Tax=Halobacillus sp. GSS1 TaxID=2815919 RepID=UPI00351CA884
MDAFLLILMSLALAGTIVFFVFAFVKGKNHRRRNFLKSGGCLYASFVLAMFLGSEEGAFLTFLVILMITALAGMVVFFILALVKGKGNRLRNFLISGGCFLALLVFALITGAMSEDVTVKEDAKANASVEEQEAEAKAKQEEEDKEREAREQAEKEQEAKEQAQKEKEEREAREQAQKEQEEREAKEKAQKEQEAKEAEEQKKKEEERKAKEEEERKAKEEAERKAKEDSVTVSQKQAVAMAEHYINFMAFSKSGLIDQLEFEGFSTEDATYGVENISVDWQEQAVIKAEEYLDFMAFSRQGLIEQLVFEGFSQEHAAYAASQVGL